MWLPLLSCCNHASSIGTEFRLLLGFPQLGVMGACFGTGGGAYRLCLHPARVSHMTSWNIQITLDEIFSYTLPGHIHNLSFSEQLTANQSVITNKQIYGSSSKRDGFYPMPSQQAISSLLRLNLVPVRATCTPGQM